MHWEASSTIHHSWLVMRNFIQDLKPEIIVLGGDIFDFPYISKFDIEYEELREGKRFVKDFELVNMQLDFLRQHASMKIVYLEGNHEFRLEQYIRRNPELRGFLDLTTALDLDGKNISFIREVDQPYRVGKLAIIHGWYWSVYHARKHLDEYSGNIIYFHTHSFQQHSRLIRSQDMPISAWGIGCLCDKNPEYARGRTRHWENGCAVIDIDEKNDFQVYPLRIINKKLMFNGSVWKL